MSSNLLKTLSISQLKRATQIREQLDHLEAELGRLVGATGVPAAARAGRRKVSAAGRARMAAAQRARWANLKKGAKSAPVVKRKRKMSAAGRARIVAAVKARWARVRAAAKK